MSATQAELRALQDSMRALVELCRVSPVDSVTGRMAVSSLKLLLCEEGSQTFNLMHTRVFLTLVAVRPGSTSISRAAAAEALIVIIRSCVSSRQAEARMRRVLSDAGVVTAMYRLLRIEDVSSPERLAGLRLFLWLDGNNIQIMYDLDEEDLFLLMGALHETTPVKEQVELLKRFSLAVDGFDELHSMLKNGGLQILKNLLLSQAVALEVKAAILGLLGEYFNCSRSGDTYASEFEMFEAIAPPVLITVLTHELSEAMIRGVLGYLYVYKIPAELLKTILNNQQIITVLRNYWASNHYEDWEGGALTQSDELVLKFLEFLIEGNTKDERLSIAKTVSENKDTDADGCPDFPSHKARFVVQSFYQDAEDAEEKEAAEELAKAFQISLSPPHESLPRWDWLKACAAAKSDGSDVTKRAKIATEAETPVTQHVASPLLCAMLSDGMRICVTESAERPLRVVSEYAGMVANFL